MRRRPARGLNRARRAALLAQRPEAFANAASVTVMDDYREKLMRGSMEGAAPDAELARTQLRGLLEQAISTLPDDFRLVFVMREIEGLSVEETAEGLGLVPATVKTRHLRARRRLQQALAPEVRSALDGAFPFAGADCEAMTERVVSAWCS